MPATSAQISFAVDRARHATDRAIAANLEAERAARLAERAQAHALAAWEIADNLRNGDA